MQSHSHRSEVPAFMHLLQMYSCLNMTTIIDHLFNKHFLSQVRFSKAIQFVDSMLYIKLNDFVHQDSNSSSLRRIIKKSLWRANMLLTLGLMYIPSKRYHHRVNMIGSSLTFPYRAVVGKILLHWKQGQAIEIHQGMQESQVISLGRGMTTFHHILLVLL
jgi:hypothetical protein